MSKSPIPPIIAYELQLRFEVRPGLDLKTGEALKLWIMQNGGKPFVDRLYSEHDTTQGIHHAWFPYVSRSKLMETLRNLMDFMKPLGLRMVATAADCKTSNDFYPIVFISRESSKSPHLPNHGNELIHKGQWEKMNHVLYGYKHRTRIFKQLVEEYETYKRMGHPLANEETIMVLDTKGESYVFLKDTYLGLWVK